MTVSAVPAATCSSGGLQPRRVTPAATACFRLTIRLCSQEDPTSLLWAASFGALLGVGPRSEEEELAQPLRTDQWPALLATATGSSCKARACSCCPAGRSGCSTGRSLDASAAVMIATATTASGCLGGTSARSAGRVTSTTQLMARVSSSARPTWRGSESPISAVGAADRLFVEAAGLPVPSRSTVLVRTTAWTASTGPERTAALARVASTGTSDTTTRA